MTTTLIAMLILFATTFGAFVGLYDDARDKIWAYRPAHAVVSGILRRGNRRVLPARPERLASRVAYFCNVDNVLCTRYG